MFTFNLDEDKIEFVKYRLNGDKYAEIVFDNGTIVDINVFETTVVEKKIKSLAENDSDVKKIKEIISKDKELDEYVKKNREKMLKNIVSVKQEWTLSPEEEKTLKQRLQNNE